MDWIDKIFDRSYMGMTKALDLQMKRQEALASNIANADTPGYRAVDVNFGAELKKAFNQQSGGSGLSTTNPKHQDVSAAGGSYLTPDYTGATRADGNNVDLDIQIGKMLTNSSEFTRATNLIRRKFSLVKQEIRNLQR